MANAWYGKGIEHFALADVDWLTGDIKVVLVDATDYTLSINVDEDLADIPALGRVATSGNLASKTATLGILDAADITIATVSGDEFEYIVVYLDSGVEGTSWLLVNIDTATGLPFTPSGSDIQIQWDEGANKIAAL